MAEFTKLDDAAIDTIAGLFGFGPVTGWSAIAAGTINSNFALEAGSERLFLRVNEGKAKRDVEYECALLEALSARGVSTPLPLETVPGRRYGVWRDRFVTAFPWIEGAHRGLGDVLAVDAGAVGKALAKLHVAGAEIAHEHERAGIYTSDDVAKRVARICAETDPYLAKFAGPLQAEVGWLSERQGLRARAKRGLIHGDLFRDNVLFPTAGGPVLLDFEQASVGTLVYDLAVCVNAWCFTEAFEPTLVRAMIAGYDGIRRIADPERASLWTELRAAALRFTVTRITDLYLAGLQVSGKEFERYFRRLVAWQELGEAGLSQLIA